jgi:peptidoglycan/LPS O-acetylase OafA/YrhL
VISGYLIGRHLLQDIQAGHLSILGFYAKRARRIFPALALVLISVWGAGWVLFSAPEFAALGKHIATAAIFSNNVLLWSESGYFDTAAINKPLLHLWSLGIEEQFYLLVPAMLWMGMTGTAGSIRWVTRLGILSLLMTIVLSNFDYAASFYLLHTRFWELATGVALAQAQLRISAARLQGEAHSIAKRDVREILVYCITCIFAAVLVWGGSSERWEWNAILRDGGLALVILIAAATAFLADHYPRWEAWNKLRSESWRGYITQASSIAGFTLICISICTLSSVNWPGAQTLFPVLRAVLLIAATPWAPLNKILGWKPLVFVGGISYPLYLWHWPAIVFWRLLHPQAPDVELFIPLIASVALAYLTKTLIEDPVRFGRLRSTVFPRPPLQPAVLGLAFAGILGAWVLVANGLPARFPPRLRAIAEWSERDPYASWRVGRCYHYMNQTIEFSNECTPIKRPGTRLMLLWGDSHAADLYPGMASIQTTSALDIAQWTAAGCPPTVKPLIAESVTCPSRRATALSKLTQLNPDTIVLGGAWELYMEKGQSADGIVGSILETIHHAKALGIKRIVIFGPGPLWNTSLPIDLFRSMVSTRSNRIPERLGKVPESIWRLDRVMAAQAVAENVQYVSLLNYFCDEAGCMTLGDRTLPRPDLLYGDRDHLTVTGSKILMAHARPQLLGED